MRFTQCAVLAAVLLPSAAAFTSSSTSRSSLTLRKATTAQPPAREAPGAGYVPAWENRQGKAPEEFLQSDMEKEDLSGMWECPLTRWDSQGYEHDPTSETKPNQGASLSIVATSCHLTYTISRVSHSINVRQAQREAAKAPKCPKELRASAADNTQGVEYFRKNKARIRQDLLKHGAVWLRGFELMQDVKGFREMHEALGLEPCLDPLHSSGLRKFASERDALYEEVNKPSLRQHYIGLHCESTAKRTAAYAAFVCFQRATEGGGRFLVADGAAILAEMDPQVLERLYNRQIRISVSNLDIPPALPGFVKEGIKGLVDAAVAPKFDMDLEMVYEADGKPGRLQVRQQIYKQY